MRPRTKFPGASGKEFIINYRFNVFSFCNISELSSASSYSLLIKVVPTYFIKVKESRDVDFIFNR